MRSSRIFLVAAMLTSVLAAAIIYFSASLAYYAISDPPLSRSSATAHDNFHIVEEAGFSLMGAILLSWSWPGLRCGRMGYGASGHWSWRAYPSVFCRWSHTRFSVPGTVTFCFCQSYGCSVLQRMVRAWLSGGLRHAHGASMIR